MPECLMRSRYRGFMFVRDAAKILVAARADFCHSSGPLPLDGPPSNEIASINLRRRPIDLCWLQRTIHRGSDRPSRSYDHVSAGEPPETRPAAWPPGVGKDC